MNKNSIVNTADVENAVSMPVINAGAKSNSKSIRKNRQSAPIWQALKKAKRLFEAQLSDTKSTEIKRKCIKECLFSYYSDHERFWLDLKNQATRLLDSKRFHEYCTALGLQADNVAEHIVFEGNKTVNLVLRDGPSAVLGDKGRLFRDPLYLDEKGLYKA